MVKIVIKSHAFLLDLFIAKLKKRLRILNLVMTNKGSRVVDGKRFLESNDSSITGTYFRLG